MTEHYDIEMSITSSINADVRDYDTGGDLPSSSRRSSPDGDEQCRLEFGSGGTWPPIVWLLMKISGIYYHKKIVSSRACMSCEKEHYRRIKEISGEDMEQPETMICKGHEAEYDLTSCYETSLRDFVPKRNCIACQSCWWDRNGIPVQYTAESIGLSRWNHRWSWILSLLILIIITGLLINEATFIIKNYFGHGDRILNLLSYVAFFTPLTVFPIMNICSKIRSIFSIRGSGMWASTLNDRFIVQRLQYLNLPKHGAPSIHFLVVCLIWPLFAATYRTYIKIVLKGEHDFPEKLSCLAVGFAEVLWGCFMYLIYTMRLSFQIQFDLLLKFIKRTQGQTELCSQLIRRALVDFKCFRQCVACTMAVIIPACVLGAATSITWHYMVISSRKSGNGTAICDTDDCYFTQKNISFMIWSDVAMFFTLGIFAIGGLDPSYIWENFHINVIFMKDEDHDSFWSDISRLLRYVKDEVPLVSVTTMFTMVTLYVAFEFKNQAIDF